MNAGQQAERVQDPKENHGGDNGQGGGPTVEITINGIAREIHRGRQTVAEIKQAGGVPLADDLEQVEDGRLKPLADDGAVTIKGGEQFVSHPKDSGSS